MPARSPAETIVAEIPYLRSELRSVQVEYDSRILDERTARLLRRNLGTILAEEPRSVRLADETIIGEVEDRFAERLNPGDRFLLDGRCLEYRRNGESGLIVEEVLGRPQTPRWTADGWPLSLELARRLYLLRVRAA